MKTREQWVLFLFSIVCFSILIRDAEAGMLIGFFMFIHGFGHLLAGYHLGIKLKMTFLGPFGVTESPVDKTDVANMLGSWGKQAFIAIGGPLLPLIVATGVTVLFRDKVSYAFHLGMVVVAVVHLINLLPVFPLDGGRIFYAVITSIHKYLFYVLFVGSAAVMVLLWNYFGRSPVTGVIYSVVVVGGLFEGRTVLKQNSIRVSSLSAVVLALIYVGLIVSWVGIFANWIE